MTGSWNTVRTRRGLLKSGVAAMAAASAGCSALPPLGSRVRYGELEVPPSGDPVYRRWLPAPTAAGPETVFSPDSNDVTTSHHYSFIYWEPQAFTDVSNGLDIGRRQIVPSLDYFGYGVERFERIIQSGSIFEDNSACVLEGDFDPSVVAETVTASGYRRDGTYRGYDLFVRSDTRRVLAVGDDALIYGRNTGAMASVRTLVDTDAGAIPRFHETDDSFRTLTERTGSRPFFTNFGVGVVPEFAAHLVASTWGVEYTDDTAYRFVAYLFDTADIDRSMIKESARVYVGYRGRDGPFGPDTLTADITVDGRFAAVESRAPLDKLRRGDASRSIPQITWGFEPDESAGQVTVRHEAGDSVDASNVLLALGDIDPESSSEVTQFADRYETVEPGDSVTVDTSGVSGTRSLKVAYDIEGSVVTVESYEVSP